MASNRLSRELFVEAAFRLLKRSGPSGITMRALGEEVGADSTAAYRHFKNKDSIVVAVLMQLLEESGVTTDLVGTPAERIMIVAKGTRRVLMENPELAVALMTATEATADVPAIAAIVVEALEELGYEGGDLVRCYQAIESLLIGMALFDGGSAPRNWEIRQNRYRNYQYRAFETVSYSEAMVEACADDAFVAALSAVVDKIVAHEFLGALDGASTSPRR